ncbi:hypothetical protein D3C71_982340 [compost metagenome]
MPSARLQARFSIDLHAMLKRAAELQGQTVTDFVASAVQDVQSRPLSGPKLSGCRYRTRLWS